MFLLSLYVFISRSILRGWIWIRSFTPCSGQGEDPEGFSVLSMRVIPGEGAARAVQCPHAMGQPWHRIIWVLITTRGGGMTLLMLGMLPSCRQHFALALMYWIKRVVGLMHWQQRGTGSQERTQKEDHPHKHFIPSLFLLLSSQCFTWHHQLLLCFAFPPGFRKGMK